MIRKFLKGFAYAQEGIAATYKTQKNFKVQIVLAILSLFFAIIFNFSIIEWLILLFTICFVLSAELLNTAIETIVDMITTDFHPKAKLAKDIGAGVVLVNAIMAIAVGLLLFFPHLLGLIK